jgi:hypothetical protein
LRKEAAGENEDGDEQVDDDADMDKYAEESEMSGQAYDPATRISTRNLRIREDTARYLLTLDLDSARYDPKTRTMVDKGATSDRAAAMVAEEDSIRSSGDLQSLNDFSGRHGNHKKEAIRTKYTCKPILQRPRFFGSGRQRCA